MTDFGLNQKDLSQIIRILSEQKNVQKALIFGSRAMGHFRPNSDVDIALKGNIDFDTLSKITYRLNEELPLPYHFDVIHYESVNNKNLKEHVDEYGKRFF